MRAKALSAETLSQLETLIGHEFADKTRLDRAFTHASTGSAKGSNYERREFLGDRVLGLCVAELLFTTFGNATAGDLSVSPNLLVSADSCAAFAQEMQPYRYIRTAAPGQKTNTQ